MTDSPSLPGSAGDAIPGAALDSGEASRSTVSTVALATYLTAVLDLLIWPARGGLSLAVLWLVLAVAVVGVASPRTRRIWVYVALITVSAVQSVYRFSGDMAWIPLLLLLAMAGEAHFSAARSAAARFLDVCLALLLSISAWRHVFRVLRSFRAYLATADEQVRGSLRVLQAILPGLLLVTLFSAIFSTGNAVFGQMLANALRGIFQIDLSAGRILFWLFFFTLILALLRPIRTRFGTFIASREIPRWQRRDASMAIWQSAGILALLSGLFFVINTLDAIYLWSRTTLPEGVSYSEFVHQGVASLITAVLVSAGILALIFQQNCAQKNRLLQWLASLWVLQNLVLIGNVFLRLKLYVDAFQLTLLRVGVALFLALVICGFGLLTWYFWRGKSLAWLLKTNIGASFALFYLLQFTNFSGWIADYNVTRWLGDKRKTLDVYYVASLGPESWPALIKLARAGSTRSTQAAEELANAARVEQQRLEGLDWRAFAVRRDQLSVELLTYLARQP